MESTEKQGSFIKQPWQILRDAGHEFHPNGFGIQRDLQKWVHAFRGISAEAMEDAARSFVLHYRALMHDHGPTKEAAFCLGYKPWPMMTTFALFVDKDERRKPPTKAEIADMKWWPPTGTTISRKRWAAVSKMEFRIEPHLKADCFSAWKPGSRLPQMISLHTFGWVPDWPNPAECTFDNVKPRRICGIHCNLAPNAAQVQQHETVQLVEQFKANEFEDPYTTALWLDERDWLTKKARRAQQGRNTQRA